MKSRITLLCLFMPLLVSVVHAGLFSVDDVKVSIYASVQQMRTEAARYSPALWKIPLGQRIIEQMSVLDNGTAIVGLKNYNAMLKKDRFQAFDLKAGKSLWVYSVDSDALTANIVAVSSVYTIIKSVFENKSTLVTIHTRTGKRIWKRDLPALGEYRVQQVNNEHFLLAIKKDHAVIYELVKIHSGEKLWSYTGELLDMSIPAAIVYKKGILLPIKKLVSLNAESGRVLWTIPEISHAGNGAPPIINFKDLYIMSVDGVLSRINLQNGKRLWKHRVATKYSITAVDPGKSRVYLRGMMPGNIPVIIALDKRRGKKKWKKLIRDPHSLVSNFIEYENKLFIASPTTLYALKQSSGKIAYTKKSSKSQLSIYPVILRRMGGNIIFIGEINIAAYRAASGAYVYKKSITSISPEADLSALEISIKRLTRKKMARENNSGPKQNALFAQQYANTQASSNAHYNNYTSAKWMGDTSTANSEYMASRIDASFSKAYAGLAVYEAAQNFSRALYQGIIDFMDADALARHKLIRNSILSSYPTMMSENFVYRPTRSLNFSQDDTGEFLQITSINLKNGKKKRTSMSVPFKDYGLWLHVDEKNKIVYQQSIGLDYNGNRPPESYLIAKPLKLP